MLEKIEKQAAQATEEICGAARLKEGNILVVGCSSSEIGGHRVGSHSSPEIAEATLRGILSVLLPRGIFLAAQCCEHLNRAIVIEAAAAGAFERVNAVPQPKAGGSFAAAAYRAFAHPVVLEEVRADAGLDIGGTLIGMHLKRVAVPVRLSLDHIGDAVLLAARTRPKYIGGVRAVYDDDLA